MHGYKNNCHVTEAKLVSSYCERADNKLTKASSFLVMDLNDDIAAFLLRCNYKCCWLAYRKNQALQVPLHEDCFVITHIM